MAELLFRIIDKNSLNSLASQRGDLIAASSDGWLWSDEELNNDFWRIISAPVLQTTIDLLMASRSDLAGNLVLRRDSHLDFTLLPNPTLFTGTRQPIVLTTLAARMALLDNTMTLTNASTVSVGQIVRIALERIRVNGPAVGNVVPVDRGVGITVRAIHLNGANVNASAVSLLRTQVEAAVAKKA